MNYAETIGYIHNTPKFARELGNDLLRELLIKLDNPHKGLNFVHIAGTNGKGSAAVMLSEILKCAGYRTGLFTSPYIERFNERIKIDDKPIPNGTLARLATKVRQVIERYDTPVSEFALDTAIAFLYFKECGCDVAVLEVGMGGRLDATNVIDNSLVSVIMSVGIDHTQYLGDTIEKIAEEKCGIIKPHGSVAVYPCQEERVLKVIERICTERDAKLSVADMPVCLGGRAFCYKGTEYELRLEGEFQKYNASAVICAAEQLCAAGFELPEEAVKRGLKAAFNPARLERTQSGLYIDGAHNLPAARALCAELRRLERPITLCVAMMQDKDTEACVRELASLNPCVIATELEMPRCESAERLCTEFKKYGIEAKIIKPPIKAAKAALETAGKSGAACVCGSLYLAGAVRHKFAEKLFYVYMLRCKDNTLYTGITTDLNRRLSEHKGQKPGGAKYTAAHGAARIEAFWQVCGRSGAARMERHIKSLSREEKERLIAKSKMSPHVPGGGRFTELIKDKKDGQP